MKGFISKVSDESNLFLPTRESRARYLRESLGISRPKFAKRYSITLSSLQGWEDKKYGGLPESGANKLVEYFKAEGISNLTIEWLMYGVGEDPLLQMDCVQEPEAKYEISAQKCIERELRTFHHLNKNAVHLVIPDDRMLPYVSKGDYVAGRWMDEEKRERAIGLFCIVRMPAGELLARFLDTGREKELYTLRCAHLDAEIVHDVALQAIAPILWIRKLGLD